MGEIGATDLAGGIPLHRREGILVLADGAVAYHPATE